MSYKAVVITVSDKCTTGERQDTSGPAIREMLEETGYTVIHAVTVPDEKEQIADAMRHACDILHADLVISTGGTGLSPRDVTPEATRLVVELEIPAIPQAMLYSSLAITPRAMLSRAAAGTRGGSLVINLPGSEKAARENLGAVIATLERALRMLAGGGHEARQTP